MLKGKIIQQKNLSGSIPSNNLLNHDLLFNRDKNGAHPASAIDGLEEALDTLKSVDKHLDLKIDREIYGVRADVDDSLKTIKNAFNASIENISDNINDVDALVKTEVDRLDGRLDIAASSISSARAFTSEKVKELNTEFNSQLNSHFTTLSVEVTNIKEAAVDTTNELNERIDDVSDELEQRWIMPSSLIFNSKAEAETYVKESSQTYPGQLITVNNDGLLEAFILDNENNLQLFSGGGGGSSGSPDKVTETQYCIQIPGDTIPSTMDDFVTDTANSIAIPNPKRKNNTITTKQLDSPGGYVYYVSQLTDLKFTSAGFDAGFTIIGKVSNADSYNIYRSNQKLMASVTITIN